MAKKIVLKVNIACEKCKQKLMLAVSRLQGIDKIEIDAAKSTLTVIGDADPVAVITRTRKAGKFAEVVSIGPPPNPDKEEPKKKPECPPLTIIQLPPSCPACQYMDPQIICSIL